MPKINKVLKTELKKLNAFLDQKSGKEKRTVEKQRKKLLNKLKTIKLLINSETKPEWMVLKVLPVIPPDIRPHIELDSGEIRSSDLNILYQRVIKANNALAKDPDDPEIICKKRKIQWAVDELFSNGLKGTVTLGEGEGKQILQSFDRQFKGKEGRFRKNLLGKTLDYTGRAVIVSGPDLKLHQCGLPIEMAMELFRPFVIMRLLAENTKTIERAESLIKQRSPEAVDALYKIAEGYPVILNRQPTLHRLNMQAFYPLLTSEKVIRLHPMVCASFAADFDGDTMVVQIPLTVDAIKEAKARLLSTNNILSPANGKPVITPSQDMVLGIYFMTKEKKGVRGEGKLFSSPDEVRMAFENELVDL